MRTTWLVLAILITTADRAWPCICLQASPCGLYDGAEAVFVGEVVEVHRQDRLLVAQFEVTRVWKGTVDRSVLVANEAGTSCSFDFRVGERYVVYGRTIDGMFGTGVCAGGGLLRAGDTDPDLPPVPGRVTGLVARYKDRITDRENTIDPIADVRVWIDTGSVVLEARSDADGTFMLSDVPPGEHLVHADLGPASEGSDRVTLRSSSDCTRALIIARPSGRVSGTLVTLDGTAVRDTEVRAIPPDHDWTKLDLTDVRTARTKEDGTFEFVGVKPGQYLLGVNVFEPARVAQPFPPTYFPGVENRDEATLITVGQGEMSSLEPFVLRRALPSTTIVARIVCQDGSNPNPGMVYGTRADGRSYFNEVTYPPVNGRYRLTVMQGVQYRLHGKVFVPPPEHESGTRTVRTPDVEVDASDPPKLVTLVAPLERCEGTTLDGSRPN